MIATSPVETRRTDPLAGGGEMGVLMRSIDWSKTPVGPVESWPQSLCTALSILLETGFPMYIAWGKAFTQFYNDGYRPILGSTKHPAAMGLSSRQTFAEIWEIIGPMFDGVMRGTPVFVNDFLLPLERHGFAEECYFIFSYSPIREESGDVGGVLVTVTETTERVLGDRRLKTLQALSARTQQSATAEQACAAAAEVLAENTADLPFSVLYLADAERKQARRTGASGELGIAAPATAELSGDDGPWALAEVLRTGAPKLLEAAEPGGRVLVLPICNPGDQRPIGVLVAGVSPRLLLDDKYRSFFDLVAGQVATAIASAQALEEAKARAEALAEIDRAKTAFFSNVSHEFRTPLTLLLGPAEDALAQPQSLAPEDLQRWQLVHRNGLRLLKLVNTLLDFSRIEAGRVQASYEPTDLAALTRDLASVFRSAVERAGVRLLVDAPPVPEPVYVDREMWEKIVLNLLSNALKFTFEGEIEVALRRVGGEVQLLVRDTGIGIAAPDLPLIFDRFHRVQGARSRSHEGTGIGLALVQELARLHGGSVSVQSAPGRGSTFTVTLPLGSAHLPRERLAAARSGDSTALGAIPFVEEALQWTGGGAPLVSEPVPAPHPEAGDARRDRVIVAEDNADMREYLRRLLSVRWEVQTANDGEGALAMAHRAPPDLVLSDVMMPRLDGFGLLQALRADPATASIPLVLISARAGEEARVEGLRAGADDYLAKPFSAKELMARVESQLALARLRHVDQAHRNELKRLFMGAPVFIALLRGEELTFELANSAYQRLVAREVVGKTVAEAFPEIASQGFFDILDRVYKTGEPYVGNEVPVVFADPGGGERTVYITFTYEAFRDDRGEIVGIAVFGFDVTEMVLARHRTEALVEQAQLADRRKDEFLAMLGHELRNPLAPIVTAVKLMELRGDDRSKREREVIGRQVTHLSRLVDDLLDVARIAQGKIELSKQVLDVAELCAKAVEMASPLFESKAHQLEIQVPRGELYLDGDPVRLGQVLSNLLTNAAKYTPANGAIALSATREGDQVVLRVKDNGIGIAPDFLPQVFDLFVQGRRGFDRAEGGLGLGLAVVKNLVQLHGGSVAARSEGRGRGTEFTVRLPSVRTAQPMRARGMAVPAEGTGKKILVVDDNADAAEMMAESLTLLGYEVAVALDGPEALARQETFGAEVAVLDLGLPVMDGYELAARLRRLATGPLRLVALTGYGQDGDRVRTREAGFDVHLTKPVTLEHLSSAILGRAVQPAPGSQAGARGTRS